MLLEPTQPWLSSKSAHNRWKITGGFQYFFSSSALSERTVTAEHTERCGILSRTEAERNHSWKVSIKLTTSRFNHLAKDLLAKSVIKEQVGFWFDYLRFNINDHRQSYQSAVLRNRLPFALHKLSVETQF